MSSVTSRPRWRPALFVVLALLPIAFVLRAAPAAHASQSQMSLMMDDNQLLYAGNAARVSALETMKSLGVVMVRATLLWNAVAHGTKNPATHHRFNPANPADYPKNAWINYDQLDVDAQAVGIKVYFDVTGPGPPWAMGKTTDPTEKPSYMPNVAQFGKFVQAVGTRFSGNFHGLPDVTTWSIWNEPNQVGWLSPQGVYNSQLHAVLPYSPILYRQLWYAARRALNRTGHKTDTVLVGETAPLGSPPQNGRTPMRPALFIQQFFCVNSKLKPYTGVQASVRGCSIFKRNGPIVASGWAHHPYTKAEPPTWNKAPAGSIVIANIAALPKLLDAIAKSTHRIASGLPIWITEMGYETNPPDPYRGVLLTDQSTYINETDWMAYSQPRVEAVTQFLLEDAGPNTHYKRTQRGYWDTYQSGLEFGPGSGAPPGTHKPAYNAYAMPIWVSETGPPADPQLELWAQVRFRSGEVTPQDGVYFQFQPTGSPTWTTETSAEPLNPDGFVSVTFPYNAYGVPGTWRALWYNPAVGYFFSRGAPYPTS